MIAAPFISLLDIGIYTFLSAAAKQTGAEISTASPFY
jgi:hypothetical protein